MKILFCPFFFLLFHKRTTVNSWCISTILIEHCVWLQSQQYSLDNFVVAQKFIHYTKQSIESWTCTYTECSSNCGSQPNSKYCSCQSIFVREFNLGPDTFFFALFCSCLFACARESLFFVVVVHYKFFCFLYFAFECRREFMNVRWMNWKLTKLIVRRKSLKRKWRCSSTIVHLF